MAFHVPRDSFIVKNCWGSSCHESFSSIGKFVEVVPFLKSGIPASPEKKLPLVWLSGWAGFLRDLSGCQLSVPWPSTCLLSATAAWWVGDADRGEGGIVRFGRSRALRSKCGVLATICYVPWALGSEADHTLQTGGRGVQAVLRVACRWVGITCGFPGLAQIY